MVEPNIERPGKIPASCNVNSTFNYAVGIIAVIVSIVAGYFAWNWMR